MFRHYVFTIIAIALLVGNLFAEKEIEYCFTGNLSSITPGAPDLEQIGSGNFTSESQSSCLQTVYRFQDNSGLSFDNDLAGDFLGETYSIEMYFKFTEEQQSWKRILNFKNSTSDIGLYSYYGKVNFYGYITSDEAPFKENEYMHLLVTRNGQTNELKVYVDGVEHLSFADFNQEAVLSSHNQLLLFRDDAIVSNEASSGNITLLKLYDYVITPEELGNVDLEDMEQDLFQEERICFDGSIDIKAAPGFSNYTWSNGTIGPNITITTGGIYTIEARGISSCSCIVRDTIEVYQNAESTADFTIEQTGSCEDLMVNINNHAVDSALSYTWDMGDGVFYMNHIQPAHHYDSEGNYQVKLIVHGGDNTCINPDSMIKSVKMDRALILEMEHSRIMDCIDHYEVLDAGLSNDISYLWSTGESTSKITVDAPGVYYINTKNEFCEHGDTINVVLEDFDIDIGDDTALCNLGSVMLASNRTDADFIWSNGETESYSTITQSGVVWLQGSKGICSDVDSIFVHQDLLHVDTDTIQLCAWESATLQGVKIGRNYQWGSGETQPIITVDNPGIYELSIYDNQGCRTMEVFHVDQHPTTPTIWIPNGFTPNGDGLNDVFEPITNGSLEEYDMQIYDRSGRIIFETSDPELGWNGINHSGEAFMNGTYAFKIVHKAKCLDRNKRVSRFGHITIAN